MLHQGQGAKELKGYGQDRSLAFNYCFLQPSQTDFFKPLNFAWKSLEPYFRHSKSVGIDILYTKFN